MISFTNVIHINRSADEVYDYLSDLEHTPEWNWAITETRKTSPGPITVGTRYQQSRRVPQPAIETLEITALEPNRRIEVEGTLAQFPAQLSYQIVEKEAGTELTNTVNLEPRGALRLVAPVLSGRIERAVGDNLGELKTRLETGNDPQSPIILTRIERLGTRVPPGTGPSRDRRGSDRVRIRILRNSCSRVS